MRHLLVTLILLLCMTSQPALSQENSDRVSVRRRLGGYLPQVGLHPLSTETVDELLNVLASSMEMRRLPSGKMALLSRLSVPTLHAPSLLCSMHTQIYWKAIGKELWADALFDSTGKLPDGLLAGNVNAFGAWDECLNTRVALNHTKYPHVPVSGLNFTGRYVSTMFQPNGHPSVSLEKGRAEREDGGLGGFIILPAIGMSSGGYGICVPSSCSLEDVRAGLQKQLGDNVTVIALESHVKDETVYLTSGDKFVISLMAIVGILMAAGTVVDLYNRGWFQQLWTEAALNGESSITLLGTSEDRAQNDASSSEPVRRFDLPALEAFSVYTNTVKLLNTTQGKDTITCLHGMRFLSMTWVVMGHTTGFALYSNGNVLVAIDMAKKYIFAVIDNATVSVDTFFVLSGVLLSYGFCKMYEKTKQSNIGMMYLHRYLRLSVPYAFMIAIAATWFVHIGVGPSWNVANQSFVPMCQKYWWRNLLYIQNFFDDAEMCLPQSWYLAADMQMFIFAPFVLLPLVWRPFLGVLWTVFLIVAFLSLRIAIWAANDLSPTSFVFHQGQAQKDMHVQYRYPWIRCTVWLTGIALGYLLHRLRGKKIRLQWWLVLLGWIASAVTAILVVYGMTGYQMAWENPNRAVSVTYGGFHRFAWGMAISWVIFACHTGYGGWVNTLLSYTAFVPLSRLTYVGYLLHINALQFGFFSAKGIVYYDALRLVYWILSQMVLTFALSYVFSMAFEVPFVTLEKILLTPTPPEIPKTNQKNDANAVGQTQK